MTQSPEPEMPSDVEKRKFFTRVALAGSQELRGLLPLDEIHYSKLTIDAQNDARAYLLYGVLDSVYQVGVAMMRWEDLLAGDEPKEESLEQRLIEKAILAEAAMWTRRLIEILTHLICFSSTNEEPYYRHFLFLDRLEAFVFKRKDQLEYFSCEQKSVLYWIDSTASEIRSVESQISLDRCWYLRERRALPQAPRRPVLNGFSDRLRIAVPFAKPRERGELGLSYQEFSRVSGMIHFSPGESWHDGDKGNLSSRFSHCWLLVQAVLVRVIELGGLQPTGICAQMLATYGKNPTGDEMASKMTKGRGKVGDFVIVGRSLARIATVKRSDYDYESYTVKYLADAPSKDVVEDDVLPYHVTFLRDPESLKKRALEKLEAVGGADGLDPQALDAALERSFAELWDIALRARILGNSSAT